MDVDPLSPTPIYAQVADILAAEIADGAYSRGPIPSESAIVQRFGVARGTARHAVDELRERGLVVTVPQRGTYVVRSEAESAE